MSLAAPRSPGERVRGRRTRVLFVAPSRRLTFVEQDLATLRASYPVDVLLREELPARRQRLWAVLRRLATGRYRLLFIWFAEPYDTPYLLLLARLLGVPSAVVVGGYELAALPELGYGGLVSGRGRLQVRLALRLADALLPVSELLAAEARGLLRGFGRGFGRGGRGGRGVETIPPGIDCDFFRPERPAAQRERLVVTVATLAEPTWLVKGLDVFAACSRLLPDVRFAVLGPLADAAVGARLRALGGDNLWIEGRRLAPDELRAWYRRAAVYAQLSARESFGIATAEAMACGCVPVATAVGGLSELVGDTGFLIPPADPRAAAQAVVQALAQASAQASDDRTSAARQRVESLFGAARRRAALAAVVARLAGGGRQGERIVPRRVPAAGGGGR